MSDYYLAIVDADKIQEYVFGPHQLKLIRGGSAVQRELNHTLLLRAFVKDNYGAGNLDGDLQIVEQPLEGFPTHLWEVIYAGGGNVVALFRDGGAARRYCADAERLFRSRTGCASATTTVAAWTQNWATTLSRAQSLVQSRKAARSLPEFSCGAPYWRTCDFCGLAPAAHRRRDPEGGEDFGCVACELRRANGQRPPYLKEIRGDLKPPRDFEALAALSKPENYLALTYIDVDGLSRFLQEKGAASPSSYRAWSNTVRHTVENGVLTACGLLSACLEPDATAPFEILLLGGDDAIVMLPAHQVFRFLDAFTRNFTIAGLSFSVGVVWAHHHFPISQFLELAKELLRSAKREPGNRVDYLVVTEAMTAGVKARDPRRTRKPYVMNEFLEMRERLSVWRQQQFPSNKVRALYRIAFEEREQATLDYCFLLSRLSEKHRGLLINQFAGGFWDRLERTGAADVAELWDFVEA